MSPRTLERWRWLGKGPAYVRIAHVLYRLEDVMAFEAAHLVKAMTSNPARSSNVQKTKLHAVRPTRNGLAGGAG
jgi:hypothetical protein